MVGRGEIHNLRRPAFTGTRGHHAGQVGRRTAFDRETYARRNVIERCVYRLKHWRGIATRYEKRPTNYRAMVVIASLMMSLPS
jgi:transposase